MWLWIAFYRRADSRPGYIMELLQTCTAKQYFFEARFNERGTTCDLDPMLEHLEALLTQGSGRRSRKRQTKAMN